MAGRKEETAPSNRETIRNALIAFWKEHGRPPKVADCGSSAPPVPAYTLIVSTFGGMKQARLSAGLSKEGWRTSWTAADLVYLAREHYDENHRLPKAHHWNVGRPGQPRLRHVTKTFGSWDALWKAAGIDPKQRVRRPTWTDQELLEELRADARASGYRPQFDRWRHQTVEERPSRDTISTRFGSWDQAIANAGLGYLPLHPREVRWPRSRIIEAIREDSEQRGRPPRAREWDVAAIAHPTRQVVQHEFGSWATALDHAGVSPRSRRWTYGSEDLLDALRRVGAQSGRVPTRPDFDRLSPIARSHTLVERWGSWSSAQKAAGFKPRPPHGGAFGPAWTIESIAEAIRRAEARLGRRPTKRWWNTQRDADLPNLRTLKRCCGSWTNAMRFTYGADWEPPSGGRRREA